MKKTCTLMIAICLMFITLNSRASVIYTQMNLTANQTSTWQWFVWGPDTDGFGLWVNPGASLRIETYGDGVIGVDEGGMIFLSALPYETEIGSGSIWQAPATASYINDATHTGLNGMTVYAGFKLRSASEEIYYGWMQLEVSGDGLSVTLIDMAYEDVAGTAILAGVVQRQVMYASEIFTEDLVTNDGHIMNQVGIQLLGVNFVVTSGAMTENTHYTVENVPAGLTLEIVSTDATNATISLNGQATANQVADTVNNLTITFLDAAFDGIPATGVINSSKSNLFVKYFGDYNFVYEDLPDPVCGTGGWVPFENSYFENYFGIWHDGTDMRLETYGKDVVGQVTTGKSYVTPLAFDTPINEESAWVASAEWPNESYLTSATYSNWFGQDNYAGIKLVLGDAIMYGWVHLSVSADGTAITVVDWAFNAKPGDAIKAGQIDNTGVLDPIADQMHVFPNPCGKDLNISLNGLQGKTSLKVMDLLGKTTISLDYPNIQDNVIVNTSELAPGIYVLQLTNGQDVFTQKVVKR